MLGFAASSPLINPSVGLMIWTLLLFGLSMFALWKLAFPRITAQLEKRQRAIEDSIDDAERVRQEAERILQEYRERLHEARQQADDIVSRARQNAEVHERRTEEQAKEQRERMMAQTRRDIENETRRAIQQIRREVADLTILATEKVTRKTLTEDDQRRLVEDALSELDFSTIVPGGHGGNGGDGGNE